MKPGTNEPSESYLDFYREERLTMVDNLSNAMLILQRVTETISRTTRLISRSMIFFPFLSGEQNAWCWGCIIAWDRNLLTATIFLIFAVYWSYGNFCVLVLGIYNIPRMAFGLYCKLIFPA